MKKTVSRRLPVILLAVLLLCLALAGCDNNTTTPTGSDPFGAGAVSETTKETWEYQIYSTYVEVTAYNGNASQVEVPSTYNNLPVTGIAAGAFHDNATMTTLKLPTSITTIGAQAFYNCSVLTTVELPETLQILGEAAFYGCTSLEELTFPKYIKTVPAFLLANCTSITEFTVPDGITSIDMGAFMSCTSMEKINLPESLSQYTSIEAFFHNIIY